MHSLLKFHLICLKGVPIRSNTVKIKGATTYAYIYGMEHSSSGTNLHIFFLSGTYIIFHRRFVQHVFKELMKTLLPLRTNYTPRQVFFNKQTLNSITKYGRECKYGMECRKENK